mmetsp:Transcript_37147/g.93253  ORF Transcript_37147/g.93253 Transcript_37147/m.93253 type:complete len:215 (+) Transcript_37147:372-1016(+)
MPPDRLRAGVISGRLLEGDHQSVAARIPGHVADRPAYQGATLGARVGDRIGTDVVRAGEARLDRGRCVLEAHRVEGALAARRHQQEAAVGTPAGGGHWRMEIGPLFAGPRLCLPDAKDVGARGRQQIVPVRAPAQQGDAAGAREHHWRLQRHVPHHQRIRSGTAGGEQPSARRPGQRGARDRGQLSCTVVSILCARAAYGKRKAKLDTGGPCPL